MAEKVDPSTTMVENSVPTKLMGDNPVPTTLIGYMAWFEVHFFNGGEPCSYFINDILRQDKG